ncbi:hypothetical protein Vadar_008250 [Vaccinium darrowii]|uniref:Uncharacterized protein n=1 Tax=Vaccinium darrowii TaxID=229202 RepID=A0ACB7WYR6_9ERIC|nr:hypothetical protein Vadar_008250 [Vaccinium darrowii]
MELFRKAVAVKLNHNDKYLVAEDNHESVYLDRDGSLKNAVWAVEFVENGSKYLRFKSCYGKYLTASNEPVLLPGSTGKKVLQSLSEKPDSSTEWEPIRDGFSVRLKTVNGSFLRPHGGLPPWRNSVTHDIPHCRATQEKILWHVDTVWAIPRTPGLCRNMVAGRRVGIFVPEGPHLPLGLPNWQGEAPGLCRNMVAGRRVGIFVPEGPHLPLGLPNWQDEALIPAKR